MLLKALETKQVNLCDILKWAWVDDASAGAPVRVVAVGTAGSGKSFAFTMKATHDWCCGDFWKEFALLRTIQCRDKSVWQAKKVSELFQLEELGLSSSELPQVRDFIAEHPERVVLVCDGLDEGSVDTSSFLWRVMSGKALRGLRVIVTSRPCLAVSQLSEDGAFNRHVQMCGFSEENVKEFVIKYLGKDQGDKMLAQLAKQRPTAALMRTPFFALLICQQFKERGVIPSTRSAIFRRVTLSVVQRCAKSRGLSSSFQHLADAPESLRGQMQTVAKVAFDRLKRKNLSFFTPDDEGVSDSEALALGFLEHLQATTVSSVDKYGFRHLTLQEYLAALHASTELLKESGDVARLARQLGCGPEAAHLNTFWVFVASLIEDKQHEELLCAIAETDTETVAHHMGGGQRQSSAEFAVDASSETGNREQRGSSGQHCGKPRQTCQLIQDQPRSTPLGVYRFLLLLQCYSEARLDHENTGKIPESACIAYVLRSLGVDFFDYRSLSQLEVGMLSRTIEAHKAMVEKVNVGRCYLTEDGLHTLLSSLLKCTRLRELNLSENWLDDEVRPSLRTQASTAPTGDLRKETNVACVGKVLTGNSKSLEALDLSETLLRTEGFRRLKDPLQECRQLKRLLLSWCFLCQSGGDLAAVLGQLGALVELSIRGNNIGDSVFASSVAPALQECQGLEKVDLEEISLGSAPASMSALASMLVGLQKLNNLNLSRNSIGNQGFRDIAPALQQCSQLRCLRLTACRLTGDDPTMALLSAVLLSLPQLEQFSLSGNDIGDAGFLQMSVALEECHHLTVLGLAAMNRATQQSLLNIVRLLQRLRRLTELDLRGEMSVGRSTSTRLHSAVEQHPSLKTLYLPKGLSDDAVQQLTSLVDNSACTLEFVVFDDTIKVGSHAGITVF